MRLGWLVSVSLGALARATLGASAPTDLMPALGEAEVCPGRSESCWPGSISRGLHLEGDVPAGAIVLPLRSSTILYARVPRDGSLALDFSNADAVLAVWARTERNADVEVYHSEHTTPGDGWQRAAVRLDGLAGQVIRLALEAEPAASPGTVPARVLVREARLIGASPPASILAPPTSRPNVLVYLIDTLRADHLGCYGYPRSTTPSIDAFASSAVLFTRAVAQSSFTLPSTASVLTGLTPTHHGALSPEHAIGPGAVTLAELLGREGYQTAAFVTNYLGSSLYGHARGFSTFRFYPEDGTRRRAVYLPSSALYRRVRRWLARKAHEPFFLYVHATDPHFPYAPPQRYVRHFLTGRYEGAMRTVDSARAYFLGNDNWGERPTSLAAPVIPVLRDMYDGDVRLADDYFGKLVATMRESGVLDRTVVVLVSDHGEEFLEHGGVAHSQTLYEEVLHVPLLVRLPAGRGGGARVSDVVQHVDILPTVLELAGVPVPPGLDGTSLVGPRLPGSDEAYSFLQLGGRQLEGLTTNEWKLVHNVVNPGEPRFELFDLLHDPGESTNVAQSRQTWLGYGKQRLREGDRTMGEAGPGVDPRKLERLRALGYVTQ